MSKDQIPEEHKEEKELGLETPIPVKPKKSFWNSNKFFSLFALLISLGTFITFAYQNYLIQKQQYRSVLPYLSIGRQITFDDNNQRINNLSISNKGMGPAFVENVKITYDGEEFNSITDFFINGLYRKDSTINISRSEIGIGDAIPNGLSIPFLKSNDFRTTQFLEQVFDNIKVEIVYTSLYDEKWKMIYGEEGIYKPVKID